MLYPAELRARVSREVAGTTARGRQDFKNGRRRKRPPSYRLRLQMARSGFGDLECILARRSQRCLGIEPGSSDSHVQQHVRTRSLKRFRARWTPARVKKMLW